MKCRCGAKAIYSSWADDRQYCRSCLSRLVEKRFRKTIRINRMVKKGDKIAVMSGRLIPVLVHMLKKTNIPGIKISIAKDLKKAKKLGANKLALGCSLDDDARAALSSLMHGNFTSYLRHDSGPVTGGLKIIKPLHGISDKELSYYAAINKLTCKGRKNNAMFEKLAYKYPGVAIQIVKYCGRMRQLIVR